MKFGVRLSTLLFSVLGLLVSLPSFAGSTIHIGSGSGTPCATGGCPLYSNEVNGFGDTLSIYQNAGGAPNLNSPFYLIFGAVNDSSGAALTDSMFSSVTALDGSPISLGALTYQGLMSSGDEAYNVAGFSSPNSSNNFVNWSGWEQAVLGITASDFGIYTLAINNASFGAKDMIDIGFNGLPLGTFAIAYGEAGNKSYGTPFTEAGLSVSHNVPEPSSVALLALGLLAGLLWHRRFSA